jgi:Cd(II)/Pb(II)-responsive transcriptional regulator
VTTAIKIGELAKRTGCQAETIRYYEREGLLPEPGRSDGNYRVYGAGHVERLSFIRHCRALGMGLAEVRTLLLLRENPGSSCAGVDELLDAHIEQLATRIAELSALERQLRQLRRACCAVSSTSECGILDELASSHKLHE